ncbi:MAG: hypothetical protein P8177_10590 [Gemmatimonadota bacterium]
MSERRYTDEETAAIFERAAQAEVRGPTPAATPGEGRTLAELQAIGAEAGLSAELVARAAWRWTGRTNARCAGPSSGSRWRWAGPSSWGGR